MLSGGVAAPINVVPKIKSAIDRVKRGKKGTTEKKRSPDAELFRGRAASEPGREEVP